MNREELKRLWFNLPHPTPKKEVRVIKVSKLGDNHYECKKVRDDKNGYSTYSSSWKTFDEALELLCTGRILRVPTLLFQARDDDGHKLDKLIGFWMLRQCC